MLCAIDTVKGTREIKNCERAPEQEWIRNCIFTYISGEIATVGTLVRKGPFLLMALAKYSNDIWNMTISFEPEKGRFRTKISCPSISNSTVVFLHKLCDGVKYENTMELLKDNFIKGKWTQLPTKYAKLLCFTSIGNFIYEKSFPSKDSPGIYCWSCRPQKQSKLKKLMTSLFQKKPNFSEITIKDVKIIERTLM